MSHDERLVALVVDALLARRELGVQRYGAPLSTRDEVRDHRVDLAQELLDAAIYAYQCALANAGIQCDDVVDKLVSGILGRAPHLTKRWLGSDIIDRSHVAERWSLLTQVLLMELCPVLDELDREDVSVSQDQPPPRIRGETGAG